MLIYNWEGAETLRTFLPLVDSLVSNYAYDTHTAIYYILPRKQARSACVRMEKWKNPYGRIEPPESTLVRTTVSKYKNGLYKSN